MAPGYKKHDMPKFGIFDRDKKSCYIIRWYDDMMKPKYVSCSYVRRTKEEARELIEDKRYELIMKWLEDKKGYVSTGSDPIDFIESLHISTNE